MVCANDDTGFRALLFQVTLGAIEPEVHVLAGKNWTSPAIVDTSLSVF
jgi:hypothetical protein